MRSQAICMAVFLALSGTAFAQTTSAPSTCNRAPHAGMRQRSAQLMTAHRAMKQACAADMANFCANVPKGCGQEKQCMMAHANQLSASCTSAMQNLRAQRRGA
jgi:hypothetical protein